MRGGGDVKEDHFVRTLFVVAEREFHGVADIFQFAGFGAAKLDTARDLAIMNVETGNDTFCNHTNIEAAGRQQSK
jgi:hypothetical protein